MKSFKEQANELLLIRKNIEVSPKYGLDEFGERESDNKIETLIQAGEYFIELIDVPLRCDESSFFRGIGEIEESLTKLKEVLK